MCSSDCEDGSVLSLRKSVGIELNGSESWNGYKIGDRFIAYIPAAGISEASSNDAKANIICSHYPTYGFNSIYNGATALGIGQSSSSVNISFTDSSLKTVESWKSYISEQYAAGTPVTIVYELTEPVTETLAQITPIEATNDTIHITADSTNLSADLTCSGWENVSDTSELTQDVEVMRSTIQQLVDEIALKVAKGDLETYLKLMQEGVYIGKSDSIYRVFIDDAGMHVQQYGEDIAVFAKRTLITPYIRVGPPDSPSGLAISKASDGGMMITNLGVIV